MNEARDILIVLHSESSTPGRIGHMLVDKGYRLDIRRHCLGDPLPETLERHAGAVIFGGPMSANDPDDWITREIDWIGLALRRKSPFSASALARRCCRSTWAVRLAPTPTAWSRLAIIR